MFGMVSKAKFLELAELHGRAESARAAAEARADLIEVRLMKELELAREALQQARADLETANAERKLLFDRIVQMSGQPALFDKTPAPEPRVAPEPVSTMPGPAARVGFDQVHEVARRALKDGSFKFGARGN